MKIYISGAMTDTNNFKYYFDKAEKKLKELGFEVCNPVNIPVQDDIPGFKAAIIELMKCDGIFILSNFTYSKGALAEIAVAQRIKLKFFSYYGTLGLNDEAIVKNIVREENTKKYENMEF